MKRMNGQNNRPSVYENSFKNFLAVTDMERHWLLPKYFQGGVYVDVGCFDSIMPVILSERFPDSEVWALDYAEKIIEFLKPRFPKVHYKTHDCSKELPFEDESVDYVCAGEFIEHLSEPKIFIAEAFRILKMGGYLAISTPLNEEKIGMTVGGPMHVWSFELQDIKNLLGTEDVTTVKEGGNNTILAWSKK